ncbi:aconitate hydratase, mitochondrial precursor [Clavispora lusitaniae ATCC 42720]|uniref:Aconitate hydratase, mitochondrial n=1 Tax=Clavispora lusitaniae (strain ATCC 42720) TaxID=306902 RepID=C4XYH9_CLAL4|nr:aconitate hydratase, mitochondrial precursor [Clavispora lusitaniae ATCC 42720]EEQ36878.1 aconitate hydratase, mitochondrial precursor [Clavispora lusitaniae ATCC 42720]
MDTSKRFSDDSETTQESWLQGSMLSGRTFTKVLVTNDNPLVASVSVSSSSVWNTRVDTSVVVLDVVGFTVFCVGGTNHVVVGDVLQVATVFQPWTGHRNVVSGGLTNSLNQDWHSQSILTIPWLEWSQTLQSVGGWRNDNFDTSSVGWRSLVGVLTLVVTSWRQTNSVWLSQLEFFALSILQGVSDWVEAQVTRDSVGGNHLWRGNESVGSRVTIVSGGEVSVERRNNGVLLSLLNVASVPLTDTWTTSIGHDDTAKVLESLQLTVSSNGGSDLFGTWRDGEDRLRLQAVGSSIFNDRSSSGHVLIRGVGTRTNQTNLNFQRPAVSNSGFLHLRNWGSQIWGEWTVDVRFQSVQVNFNDLVVLTTFISSQEVLLVKLGELGNLRSTGSIQVVNHRVVEWENRGGSTDFGTHVTDSTHTSTREGADTVTEVLDNSTSTTLDGGDTSQLQDDILWRSPARHSTGQLDTDNLWSLQFPWQVGHNVDGISTTNTNSQLTQTTSVWSVRVSTNQQSTWESVVFQDDSVNNTGTWLPETQVVLGTGGSQEVVNFLVQVNGSSQILDTTNLGLNQVVTVHGGRSGNLRHTSRHELQNGHLSGGILTGNSVWSQLQVGDTSFNLLFVWVVQVTVQQLFSVSQRSVQSLLDDVDVFQVLFVLDVRKILQQVLVHLGVSGKTRCGKTTNGAWNLGSSSSRSRQHACFGEGLRRKKKFTRR